MTIRAVTGATAVLAMLSAACDRPPREPPGAGGPAQSPVPGARATPHDSELAGHMGEHFWGMADAHDAAMEGDLDGIREAAAWLASHEEPARFPPAAGPYLDAFHARSREAASAPDLNAAGVALSEVAASCGACHRGLGVLLPTLVDEQPDPGRDLSTRMGAHIRAADLMWEALVAPSDEAWEAGVSLLASVEILPSDVTGSPADARVVAELLERVREIAAAGADAPSSRRPTLYGQLVATCGRCHQALGKGFDPGP